MGESTLNGERVTDVTQQANAGPNAVQHLTVEAGVKRGREAPLTLPDRPRQGSVKRRTVRIRSASSNDRPSPGCPNCYRSDMGECWSRRSPSSVVPRSIMASDLAATPRSGFTAQVCGDAHLSNFGLFASPERKLMFDVNDFDETLPGPWEWDLKRLAASAVIAARDREFTDSGTRTAALEVGRNYRREMVRLAGLSTLEVWYSHIDVAGLLAELEATAAKTGSKADKRMAARTAQTVAKARSRDSLQALGKLAAVVNGRLRIVSDPRSSCLQRSYTPRR